MKVRTNKRFEGFEGGEAVRAYVSKERAKG